MLLSDVPVILAEQTLQRGIVIDASVCRQIEPWLAGCSLVLLAREQAWRPGLYDEDCRHILFEESSKNS